MKKLTSAFFARDALEVGPDLLGKLFVVGGCSVRINEVEAYRGSEDAASHAYRGPTARNEVMFGPAGYLYVYFTYGMHYCANVVVGQRGQASAVLLRGGIPIAGIPTMKKRRGISDVRNLCNGPAKLAQALALDRKDNGTKLIGNSIKVFLADDGFVVEKFLTGPRIGIKKATDLPWRFYFDN